MTAVYTKKPYLEFFVFTSSAVKPKHVLFVNEPFFCKMQAFLSSSNIPLYNEKISVEKFGKVLEMELKTYNSVSLKFTFEKIKFKVLHYSQHDFIRQRPGFSKNQTSMFKSLIIKYFFVTKVGVANVLLKLDYL